MRPVHATFFSIEQSRQCKEKCACTMNIICIKEKYYSTTTSNYYQTRMFDLWYGRSNVWVNVRMGHLSGGSQLWLPPEPPASAWRRKWSQQWCRRPRPRTWERGTTYSPLEQELPYSCPTGNTCLNNFLKLLLNNFLNKLEQISAYCCKQRHRDLWPSLIRYNLPRQLFYSWGLWQVMW